MTNSVSRSASSPPSNDDLEQCYLQGARFLNSGQYTQAARFFEMGADHKHPRSMYSLGGLYLLGLGVEANEKRGDSLIKDAAALGNPEAAYCIATDKLHKKQYAGAATVLYRLATGESHLATSAKCDLGTLMVREKIAVRRDPADSRTGWDFIEEAAEEGHPEAQYHLGIRRLKSDHPEDREEGLERLASAADTGHEKAAAELERRKRAPTLETVLPKPQAYLFSISTKIPH